MYYKSMYYKIVVEGILTERFAGAFAGMKMQVEGGQTIITGQIVDQSHLYGILDRISGLGLALVSVQALPESLPEYARGEDDATVDYQNKRSEA